MCIEYRSRDGREKQPFQAAISHPSGQSDRSIGAVFEPVTVDFRARCFSLGGAFQRMKSRVACWSLYPKWVSTHTVANRVLLSNDPLMRARMKPFSSSSLR